MLIYALLNLQWSEKIILMGPTGIPTELPHNQKVCLIGGGTGNAVLLAIAEGLRKNNCEILYFAAYRNSSSVFYRDKIEAVAHQVIWSFDTITTPFKARPNDLVITGNVLQAIQAYAKQKSATYLSSIDRLIVIVNDQIAIGLSASF